jgi:formimidoylglutamate deiminase
VRVPAMPNAHSHAFQRGLRGRAERVAGAGGRRPADAPPADDFWTWREAMYALANALDPDSIERAGRAAYEEMAAAGYGAVGEFHYVHHRPDGSPYDDPNAMAKAVARAARAAGLAIVLLPAAYARAGPGLPPEPRQRRFCDPSPEAFLARVEELRAWAETRPGVSVGVAAHSARAVPAEWLEAIAAHSEDHGLVRHVHAAEQPRELEEVRAEHGCSPIELLERTGFLGPLASVVHAIHVSPRDIELIWASGATVVSCPTTEGNLGDGHPPLLRYRDAGVPLAIGSDSQVRIDPFEEARELETLARREGLTRHALLAASGDLWAGLCRAGARSLGVETAGEIEIDPEHPDLRGIDPIDLPRALVTCASAGVVRAGSSPRERGSVTKVDA